MFWLLMRVRWQSLRNTAREAWARHPAGALMVALSGIGLFVGMILGFLLFFRFAGRMGVLDDTAHQIFYFLFLFLLAGAVPFVASTLLQSSDYGLLFAAPVPPRAVIAAKLLDATVTNSLQFSILGIPAIVACALAVGQTPVGWLLLPILVLLFVLLPALITALGLLLALLVVGIGRLRSAISLLNAAMALVVSLTIVMEADHLPVRPQLGAGWQGALQAPLRGAQSPAAKLWPSAWFAQSLLALRRPDTLTHAAMPLLKILLVVGGLFTVCMLLGGRLLTADVVAEDAGGGAVSAGADLTGGLRRWLGPSVAALVAKDFRYLYRDSVLLSQLLMPLILFAVPFLLAWQTTGVRLREEMYPLALVMVGIILFMQTSILSLSSVGLEGRSFWVVRNAPLRPYTILWAKFVLSATFTATVGLVLTLFAGLAFGMPFGIVAAQAAGVVISACALCGMGVGLSGALPRFVYENPAHRVSAWALILGFFAWSGYLMLVGVLYGLAWLASIQPNLMERASLFYGGAALIHLLVSLYVLFAPLSIGARRLEAYQWEH